MGIAEVVEGCSIIVGEIFFAVAGGDEAVLINGQVAAVGGAVHRGRSAVQGGVGLVGADGFALPLACRRADEAHPPGIAAVPEGGNGVKAAVAVEQQVQRHVVEGIGVGLFTFVGQLHHPPGFGGKGPLRRAGEQRGAARLPRRVPGLCLLDAGFIGKGDQLQQPAQHAAQGAAQPFRGQHGGGRRGVFPGPGGAGWRGRAEQQDHRQ